MFVTASVFQFASNLLEVLITLSICTLLVITSALPTPTAVMSCAFVTKSFILLNASERSACMVNELVVTDPTKNLEPLSTGPPSPTSTPRPAGPESRSTRSRRRCPTSSRSGWAGCRCTCAWGATRALCYIPRGGPVRGERARRDLSSEHILGASPHRILQRL